MPEYIKIRILFKCKTNMYIDTQYFCSNTREDYTKTSLTMQVKNMVVLSNN